MPTACWKHWDWSKGEDMKKNNKRKIDIAIMVLLAAAIIIPWVKNLHENSHVIFADKTMGEVLSEHAKGKDITPASITYKDLKTIYRLDIGFSGYYETIRDIRHCTNVELLYINEGSGVKDEPAWKVNQGKVDRELTPEEIEKLQRELGRILPKMENLKRLGLADTGGCDWTSTEFLRGCDQIEDLVLIRSSATDYSALKTCTSLKGITLTGSQISKAEDIIGLPKLEAIEIADTPLAENPKEVEKLRKAYPNANIYLE